METTARIDLQKLQVLNDRIALTLDALNQVRMSAHNYGSYGNQNGYYQNPLNSFYNQPFNTPFYGYGPSYDPRFFTGQYTSFSPVQSFYSTPQQPVWNQQQQPFWGQPAVDERFRWNQTFNGSPASF